LVLNSLAGSPVPDEQEFGLGNLQQYFGETSNQSVKPMPMLQSAYKGDYWRAIET
jgi:hypothetical protein